MDLIAIIKIGNYPPMGYEDEKGLFDTWENAKKAALKLLAENSKLDYLVLRSIEGQIVKITR